jgi:predicted nucleic acid-binding protein
MKLVIADTGALISLGLVGHIDLIERVFGNYYIANAVWEELLSYENPEFEKSFLINLGKRVINIESRNHFSKQLLNKILLQIGEESLTE